MSTDLRTREDSTAPKAPLPNGHATPEASEGPSERLFVPLKEETRTGAETIRRPSVSYWQDAWARLKKNKVAVCAGLYIIVLGIAALVVPEVIPYSYADQEIWNKHRLPTLGEEALVVPSKKADYEKIPSPLAGESESGEGANDSGVVSAGSATVEPPPAPQNVRVVGQPLTTGVTLRWEPVEDVEGYKIYRSISEGSRGVPIGEVTDQWVSYRDTSSLAVDAEYYYTVSAYNTFGDSRSNEIVTVDPKLAITVASAKKLDPNASPGETVKTGAHYLGTDYLGRDMLARVMVGARISLFIGFGAPILYILIGIIYGSISGYFGGVVDDAMMRVTDIVATVPELLVVIMLQVVMGSGITTLLVALVAVAWARSARQIRGEVLRLREMEFVHASKVLGTDFHSIVGRHLLPNVMGTVLVVLTLAVPQAIFTEAFLSFIGLGISPPMASWGTVTKEGAKVFTTYPHELIIPSVLISATMLAFNLFGDGLRDALDPKLRGAK